MPASPRHDTFADWLRSQAAPLTHLDAEAPLDDLEPLRGVIGDARVVAIGENSHFITEFALMRQRILRFLVERCGFTVLAFEYGFSESFPLDAWAAWSAPPPRPASCWRPTTPTSRRPPSLSTVTSPGCPWDSICTTPWAMTTSPSL
ncbi:hypothetical protein [Microbispora sp. NPDC049633]|uniref:hypothetical protein n=1 Tax=Microbispora sp. NPDC049633 TaxID=3154355 RepID=UPI00344AA0D4